MNRKSKKNTGATVKMVLSLLPAKQKKRLLLVAGVLFAAALMNVAGIASIMPFMRVLADPQVVHDHELFMRVYELVGSPELSTFLLFVGIGVLAAFVVANLFMALSVYVQHMFVQSLAYWLTSRLMRGYLEQPYEFFLNRNGAELSKNVFSEVGQVVRGVINPAMKAASKGSLSLVILVFLIVVDPLVALIAFVVLGGSYLIIFKVVKRRLSRLGKKRVEANRNRFRLAAEAFGGIKQVKLSSRETDYMRRFNPHARTFEKTKAKTQIIGKLPKFILEVVAIGGILAIALVMYALEGSVAGVLPILSLYAVAGYRLMPALQELFSAVAHIRSAGASVDVLYADMKDLDAAEERNRKEQPEQPEQPKETQDSIRFEEAAELRNIHFRYPNTSIDVLKSISLKIKKNTTVGFVGPTGCGKTTLIDIILGLLEPQSGDYLVDGEILEETGETSVAAWQGRMGYVPQDIYLADDTVTRNVAFGVPDEELDFEAVRRACSIANIDEFIRSELSEGYDTVVGERGIRLSGGQRQRIGIARALYHNPDVLILDEATSALDGRTETAIMEAIHTLAHKKTIIMIAHRLTTLRDCDEIFVLDKGVLSDSGSYQELQQRNEQFRADAGSRMLS